MLNATEEHFPKFQPHDPQIPQLNDALSGCRAILQDLHRLKEHFDNIGSQTQITWERMGWGLEELADIRGKFSLQIQMLNLLNTNMLRYASDAFQEPNLRKFHAKYSLIAYTWADRLMKMSNEC